MGIANQPVRCETQRGLCSPIRCIAVWPVGALPDGRRERMDMIWATVTVTCDGRQMLKLYSLIGP